MVILDNFNSGLGISGHTEYTQFFGNRPGADLSYGDVAIILCASTCLSGSFIYESNPINTGQRCWHNKGGG